MIREEDKKSWFRFKCFLCAVMLSVLALSAYCNDLINW